MALMGKRWTKMVSIRLRDDEYLQLKELCAAIGARSVSDLAHEAMFRMLIRATAEPASPNLEALVRKLDQTVANLGEKMEQIESRLPLSWRVETWVK